MPHLAPVLVTSVDTTGPVVVVHARTHLEKASSCTGCGSTSDWIHSRYTRRLADSALGGRPARIELQVRRLYCENPLCPKTTFAEQIGGLTVRYQRRTPLLQRLVQIAGVLLAGRGGARLLHLLHAGLSRTSVLLHLMRIPLPTPVAPRVLGVDDFALYGRAYGTLLVDADTRLPITLWEGRDAETLRDWLLEHPGVQIACRDGSPIYRQGSTSGAPDAIQVSDRFHLWQGLSRRVQQIATVHHSCLPAATPEPDPDPAAPADTAATPTLDSPAVNHTRHLFETVHALTDTGRAYNSVARELGLNWRTVRKYATASSWQECVRHRPRVPSPLDRYLEYLQQRWDEGEHNAKVLHEELKAKGYLGHYQRVKMAVAPLRRGLPVDQPRQHPPSPREVARWITSTPPRRTLDTAERLQRLLAHCPELDRTHTLVRAFAAMFDTGDPGALPDWLNQLETSRLPGLPSLAKVIRDDLPAVVQAITSPYSSGVNEGRITDVKLQKRLMAGRAKIPLLRQRVVLIAHLRRRTAAAH
ncbi:ISL3 family transposase [Actinoplanes sp. NEAU-A11]|uniref:ISL3 family transposase n=1 Tax=Actinoplanes aureus TaxID=2792083 RepID=A0A931CIT3_9ACTN|nr:ISL3 family transposase [Actinoplanes aureus]